MIYDEDDFDISRVSVNCNIYSEGGDVVIRELVALGSYPILIVEPGDDVDEAAEEGTLSMKVSSTSFGDTPAAIADTLELLVDALRGVES